MSRIFWDTHLFLYLAGDRGARADRAAALREWSLGRGDRLYTSAFTLGEVLAWADAAGGGALAMRCEHAIHAAATVLPFDRRAAARFAEIRRDPASPVGAADAVQLAGAAAADVDLFVTGDDRLDRVHVAGIQFIRSLEKAAP